MTFDLENTPDGGMILKAVEKLVADIDRQKATLILRATDSVYGTKYEEEYDLATVNKALLEYERRKWISVKDRLPEERHNPVTDDFEEVICFVDFGGQPKRTDVRAYHYGTRIGEKEAHFWHGPQIMDSVVTHWMYKPEPPKEE